MRKRHHRAAKAKITRVREKQHAILPEYEKRIKMTDVSTPLPSVINNIISEYEHNIVGVSMHLIDTAGAVIYGRSLILTKIA
jgi:hypothetical protein